MIRAVIFDLDGVLIDSEPVYLERLYRFLKTKNPSLTQRDLWKTVGISTQTHWRVVESLVQNGQSKEALESEYKIASKNYEAVDYKTLFRKEARELLKRLKEKNLKIAVASSSRLDTIKYVLQCNEIDSYFTAIMSGEQFKQSKPNPEIYQATAKILGVPPQQCLAVEDSGIGIEAALGADMQVAALKDERFGFDQSKATYQINNLLELDSVIS